MDHAYTKCILYLPDCAPYILPDNSNSSKWNIYGKICGKFTVGVPELNETKTLKRWDSKRTHSEAKKKKTFFQGCSLIGNGKTKKYSTNGHSLAPPELDFQLS